MARLSVNLNKVALLRNSRGGGCPDLLEAAQVVIAAGAPGRYRQIWCTEHDQAALLRSAQPAAALPETFPQTVTGVANAGVAVSTRAADIPWGVSPRPTAPMRVIRSMTIAMSVQYSYSWQVH